MKPIAILAALLLAVTLPLATSAQTLQTPHTLKLDAPANAPKATLADAALLVGHWQGEFLGGQAEELWLPAAGGALVGMFRLHEAGQAQFYELMTVTEEDGTLVMRLKHFHADMKGWEEKDERVVFRLVKATPDGLWFEGLTYLRDPDGTLRVYVALHGKDGKVSEAAAVFKPVAR